MITEEHREKRKWIVDKAREQLKHQSTTQLDMALDALNLVSHRIDEGNWGTGCMALRRYIDGDGKPKEKSTTVGDPAACKFCAAGFVLKQTAKSQSDGVHFSQLQRNIFKAMVIALVADDERREKETQFSYHFRGGFPDEASVGDTCLSLVTLYNDREGQSWQVVKEMMQDAKKLLEDMIAERRK